MRARFSILLTTIDYAILAFMLFLVTLDVSKGFQDIGYDLLFINLIVFGLYLMVAIIANIPRLLVTNAGRWTKLVLGGVASLLIIFMFPALLRFLLLIFQIQLSVPVDIMLLIVFMIRAFVGVAFRRKWKEA